MLNKLRVRPIVVWSVGLALCLLVGGLGYYLFIQPKAEDLAKQNATYAENAQYEDPGPMAQAQKSYNDAVVQVGLIQAQWNVIQFAKNPDIDLSDRYHAWKQYINEIVFRLGPDLESWLGHAGVSHGGVTLPPPPSSPNDPYLTQTYYEIPLNSSGPAGGGGGGGFGGAGGPPMGGMGPGGPPMMMGGGPMGPMGGGPMGRGGFSGFGRGGGSATGAGSVKVIGTFAQVLAHVRSWPKFNRIVLVDNVSLSGMSPFLTATYSASIFEFPRNADKPGGDVVGAPAGGAAPGGGMGMPGGMPFGGPGGMPGGMPGSFGAPGAPGAAPAAKPAATAGG